MTDTSNAAQARNLVRAMTLDEKAAYLKSRGWRRIDGDRWEALMVSWPRSPMP
jgi:hypothetical protein